MQGARKSIFSSVGLGKREPYGPSNSLGTIYYCYGRNSFVFKGGYARERGQTEIFFFCVFLKHFSSIVIRLAKSNIKFMKFFCVLNESVDVFDIHITAQKMVKYGPYITYIVPT